MSKSSYSNIADEADNIYKNLCKRYGEYFNYIREQKKLSLRELSKRTNISIALISLLENGDKLPRIETLIRLALALDIPFEEVFGKKSTDLEPNSNIQSTAKRDDENLRNTLLKMGCNKDGVKDIIEFIEFKIYKQKIGKLSPAAKSNILLEIMTNGNVDERTFDYLKLSDALSE